MGMLNGDMGQDDTIGEDDFGGLSGLGGMDPETGQPNIGSWATAKDPNRTMDKVMGMFDDDPVAMAKGYGPKGIGYQHSDSFNFDKSAKQHTNFVMDLLDKEFQNKYGKPLTDFKSHLDSLDEKEKEAFKDDATKAATAALVGIPDNIRDAVAQGINVNFATIMGYAPTHAGANVPAHVVEDLNLKEPGAWNLLANYYYDEFTDQFGQQLMNTMLGEEPGTKSDVTAIESGDGPD